MTGETDIPYEIPPEPEKGPDGKPVIARMKDTGMLNLRGHRFGKLLVLRLLPRRHDKKRMWLCKCDCGAKPLAVRHDYLLHSNSPKTHCGCENRGMPTLHPEEYHIWNSMIRRCTNETHVGYAQYGGRGIKVCPQWLDAKTGFQTFLTDIGKRPSKGHSIDRKDPDGNYEPGNVQWATSKHQARNKRNSVFLDDPDHPGAKIPAAELAERWGVTYQVMRGRLIRQGKWPGYSRDGEGNATDADEIPGSNPDEQVE